MVLKGGHAAHVPSSLFWFFTYCYAPWQFCNKGASEISTRLSNLLEGLFFRRLFIVFFVSALFFFVMYRTEASGVPHVWTCHFFTSSWLSIPTMANTHRGYSANTVAPLPNALFSYSVHEPRILPLRSLRLLIDLLTEVEGGCTRGLSETNGQAVRVLIRQEHRQVQATASG